VLNQRLHDCFPLLAEGGETVGRDADAAVGGTTTLRGREGERIGGVMRMNRGEGDGARV